MVIRVLMALMVGLAWPSAAIADEARDTPEWVQALIGGKAKLDMRLRWEAADIDGFRGSNAVTLRTRLGYGTRSYHGFTVYGELENVVAFEEDAYFDGVEPNTGNRSIIADPETTDVNQAYLAWSSDGLSDDHALADTATSFIGGRQRIVLDDHRFIGNVGWRQNEQTYDAGLWGSSFGVEGLSTRYGYVWDVNRIFSNRGAPGAATKDFNSNSHILNATWSGFAPVAVSVFGYWLDFSDSLANSSDTYGFRATGRRDLGDDFFVGYTGSYAYQQDGGANPTSYGAHYYNVEGVFAYEPIAALTIGYEVLGSDGGVAQFRTPLATAHKFNGWADVFLDNGGTIGLRDLYIAVAPQLPLGLSGQLVYHRFESDSGGVHYGDEFDAMLSRKFFDHLTVLAKVAYYEGGSSPRPDRYRFWLETTLAF